MAEIVQFRKPRRIDPDLALERASIEQQVLTGLPRLQREHPNWTIRQLVAELLGSPGGQQP
jgi:hypothetical protein